MDDKFHRNRKVRAVRRARGGLEALGVWVVWWSWCLDDPDQSGVVPLLELSAADLRASRLLVEHGLWEPVADGFLFHDFDEYNVSAAKADAKREADRVRVAAKRADSRGDVACDKSDNRATVASDKSDASQKVALPSRPVPVPVPTKDSAPLALVSAEAAPPKAPRTRKAPTGEPSTEEAEAWRVWCEVIGKCDPARAPSAANLTAIRKAIAAHDVATVCDAFRGVTLSAHHMGDAAYRQPASVLRLGDARIEGHAGRWREQGRTAEVEQRDPAYPNRMPHGVAEVRAMMQKMEDDSIAEAAARRSAETVQ
jgi:hypothetical protein